MNDKSLVHSQKNHHDLSLTTKLAYGVGELAGSLPGNILVFFFLIFLTDAVGLSPTLAGTVVMIAKIWDGINDPLVGWLSDRTRSPLGRRYPWILGGAIPLGLFFALHWVIPPINNQLLLFSYYTLISLGFYAAFTSVLLPFGTLVAEITESYDQRTSLISFKSIFSIGGSIFALTLAQIVFQSVENEQQQYLILGATCSLIAIIAIFVSCWGTYKSYFAAQQRRSTPKTARPISILQQFRVAFSNRPFLYVIGIYLFSWLSLQITAAILPYFVVYWMGLPRDKVTQMALCVQGTALLTLFLWSLASRRLSKKTIYCLGIPFTIAAELGFLFLQPNQENLMYALGIMAGIGLATTYLVPWSMLPDVIDLDELNTGERREGIFYGFLVQIQKVGVAIAIFLVGRILDWSGWVKPIAGEIGVRQPDSVLWAIRLITGLLPAVILTGGLVLAFFYPISREVHNQILSQLNQRRKN